MSTSIKQKASRIPVIRVIGTKTPKNLLLQSALNCVRNMRAKDRDRTIYLRKLSPLTSHLTDT